MAYRNCGRLRASEREIAMGGSADDSMGEAMLRYVAAARPVQELISQTLTQVSGFALLLMTSHRSSVLAEGALAGACKAAAWAAEGVRALNVPEAAAHHHHHLRGAAAALGHACAAAQSCSGSDPGDSRRSTLTRALRVSSDHLRGTARLLPGFELVDCGQACCATHAPQRLLQEAT
jgi:hypothetical protein